jgi:tyrosine phenol-lyase
MSNGRRSWAEPYKIKMVEPLRMTTEAERATALAEAGYNTFLLRSEDVYIDLLTDSGTNAMSDRQWAGMMLGDEAYAGSATSTASSARCGSTTGTSTSCPRTRAAAQKTSSRSASFARATVVPGNMYFTTTRAHQELAGATFVDVIIDEAHDPTCEHPFKGNVSLEKLDALVSASARRRFRTSPSPRR